MLMRSRRTAVCFSSFNAHVRDKSEYLGQKKLYNCHCKGRHETCLGK